MGTVTVDIDVDDVLDQIDDRVIFDEARRRRGNTLTPAFQTNAEMVTRAINLIRLGRIDDGTTLLEREFIPRWKDKADCEVAYRTAMALKGAE